MEVREDGVTVLDSDGKERRMAGDTIVHALCMYPSRKKASLFDDIADVVYYTGDCATDRGNLWTATSSAHYIALEL